MEAVAVPLWSSRRAREAVAYLGLAGLAASSAAGVAGAEGGLGVLVPAARKQYPGWVPGPHLPPLAHGSALPLRPGLHPGELRPGPARDRRRVLGLQGPGRRRQPRNGVAGLALRRRARTRPAQGRALRGAQPAGAPIR